MQLGILILKGAHWGNQGTSLIIAYFMSWVPRASIATHKSEQS